MATQGSEALALGKRVIEGLERKDAAMVNAVLHQDIVLHVPFPLVAGENMVGTRRQVGEAVRRYLDESNQLTETVRFNNKVWRTTSDGLAMFQADGEVKLRDGKITQWWEYYNPVIAANAFGAPLDSIPA